MPENLKRRKRRSRKRSRRNPEYGEIMYMNPDQENPSGIMDTLVSGSEITHDISVVDAAVAGSSFLLNNHINKYLGLQSWPSVLASAIIPFITGAIAGMGNPRWGTMAFLGGQSEFFLKVVGMLTGPQPLGLKPNSGDWVLQTPAPLLGQLGLSAPAGASQFRYNPGAPILQEIVRHPSKTVVV